MWSAFNSFVDLMQRGGVMMWPLLLLSVIGVALSLERAWFWIRTNGLSHLARVERMAKLLRQGDAAAAAALAADDASVYGRVVRLLLEEGASEATAVQAIESQRSRLERFMPTLSTIITAAPMFGILGTVTGIISAFRILSGQMASADPRAVSGGIAEALLTTVAGLVVAIIVLFPYNAFRAQSERTLGRLEALVAAAEQSQIKNTPHPLRASQA